MKLDSLIFLFYWAGDTICFVDGMKNWNQLTSSQDKHAIAWSGLFHETFNEVSG